MRDFLRKDGAGACLLAILAAVAAIVAARAYADRIDGARPAAVAPDTGDGGGEGVVTRRVHDAR